MTFIRPSGSFAEMTDEETFLIVCPCGKRQEHRIGDLKRAMPPTFNVEHMLEDMRRDCRVRPGTCEAEIVSINDGMGD